MADVRSKNLYELLGNDPELDPDREPEPPTRAVDRPIPRVGKRDAPKEAHTQPQLTEQNARRGGRATGNEAAFRDRGAGSRRNRDKPIDEGKEPERRAIHARGGERGDRVRNDRQSRTGVTRKQVGQGWGAQTGDKAWDDERAAEDIAKTDETEPQTPAGEEPPQEPVDKSKSYADYLAELAEKHGDLSAKAARAPNEGTKTDKKWSAAKEFKRGEEEEEYIKASSEKAKREKQRKEKQYVDVDMRFVEPARGSANGPRGGRGGRGGSRGGPRGGSGGGRGAGPRGGDRAAAAGATGPSVTVDEKNFPTLGSK